MSREERETGRPGAPIDGLSATVASDVGAVLCAYKSSIERVGAAVRSLLGAGVAASNIIVVDNSSDPVLADAMARVPMPYLAAENRGLGAAFNLGERALPSSARFVFFGNVDIVLAGSAIAELRRALVADPQAWAADPRQQDPTGTLVHGRVALRPRRWRGRGPMFFADVVMEDAPSTTLTAFPCAGAMLVRRSHLKELDGWDEAIFLEAEDLDLGFRAWRRGLRALYVPAAVVQHEVGMSTEFAGRDDVLRRFAGGLASVAYIASSHLGWRSAIAVSVVQPLHGARRALRSRWARPFTVSIAPSAILPPRPVRQTKQRPNLHAWKAWTRAFRPVDGVR